jgi:hypothetical protein
MRLFLRLRPFAWTALVLAIGVSLGLWLTAEPKHAGISLKDWLLRAPLQPIEASTESLRQPLSLTGSYNSRAPEPDVLQRVPEARSGGWRSRGGEWAQRAAAFAWRAWGAGVGW